MRKNPNTPALWDKLLFEGNKELLKSPYYLDKLNKVYGCLKGKKGKFLDVGFGVGNLEKKLVKNKSKLEIYGIDFSRRAVAAARRNIKGKFFVSKSQKMPFRESFFDFAVMLDVLEHISEEESQMVLDEINRVLKKGAHFIVSVPVNEDLEKMNREKINFNRHLREYTPMTIQQGLRLSGFKILRQDFIYAFSDFYFLKNWAVKIFPKFRKPNLLIIYATKK